MENSLDYPSVIPIEAIQWSIMERAENGLWYTRRSESVLIGVLNINLATSPLQKPQFNPEYLYVALSESSSTILGPMLMRALSPILLSNGPVPTKHLY